MNISLLRESFNLVRPHADAVAQDFYATLFSTYPQVKPLFKNADPAEQRRKLMASVAAVVAAADEPEVLEPVLEAMGARHVDYGVSADMYAPVTHTMMGALARAAGEAWTPELASSWLAALEMVSARMIEAQQRAA
ncbi:MAG: flavohemoprotein [Planctomycetota bacterium]|nr:MAG: flavohemoprotein [Planctomycetota bacterium]